MTRFASNKKSIDRYGGPSAYYFAAHGDPGAAPPHLTTFVGDTNTPVEVAGLTFTQHVIVSHLRRIGPLEAVYAERDDDDVLMVFAVVAEHTDEAYDAILDAEEAILSMLPEEQVELRIRAHQNRRISAAVPVTCEPLFLR